MEWHELLAIIGLSVLIVTLGLYFVWLFITSNRTKTMTKDGVLLEITLEKNSDVSHEAVNQMWNNIHYSLYEPWYRRLFKPQPYVTFEIKSENRLNRKIKETTFNFWVPEDYVSRVKSHLKSLYLNIEINEVDIEQNDYIPDPNNPQLPVETAELGLSQDSAFAVKLFTDFDTDPLSSITSVMSNIENRETAIVQLVARPRNPKWRQKAEKTLTRYEKTNKRPSKKSQWTNFVGGFFNGLARIVDGFVNTILQAKPPEVNIDTSGSSIESKNQKDMFEKIMHNPYEIQIRIAVASPMGFEDARSKVNEIVASFKDLDGTYNQFRKEFLFNKKKTLHRMKDRYFNPVNTNDILTTIEMAGFCHFPNANISTQGLKKITSKKTAFPLDVSTENAFAIAIDKQGNRKKVGLNEEGRMRHMYIAGMTGVGKSTLLESMIVNDVNKGNGVVVIDPHGELVDDVLHKIPANERDDIFVLNPSDFEYPFGLNLLELSSKDPGRREMEKILVIDAYITAMKRVFGDSAIGPSSDDIFRMSCAAILDSPNGGGLLEMLRMITSEKFRERIIPHIKNPMVKDYWEVIFPTIAGQGEFQAKNLNAPLNKIRRFVANSLVSNIICQEKSTINIADTINNGGVILARLSRGDMGFENSSLIGTMLISKIQIAAMQRVNLPKSERTPTFLYTDEFQNFVGDSGGSKSFAEILSEARKYKLGLVIAHQFSEQLKQDGSNFLSSAIFNNCGTTITFRVGAPDGEFFAKVYENPDNEDDSYETGDLTNLGLGEVVMRVMRETGVQSHPFLANTFPPAEPSPRANPKKIIERSRRVICKNRTDIEKSIHTRMMDDDMEDLKPSGKR